MSSVEGAAGHCFVGSEELLDEYVEYLRRYRNLVETSVQRHRFYAGRFLKHFRKGGRICLSEISNMKNIQEYAIDYARRHGRGSSHGMFSTLRVLLRYLHMHGLVISDLSEAVPTVHRRQLSHVPRGMSAEHVAQLLGSIDRTSALGKRDYAIIQLLSAYGVRGVHVRRLRLEDVQWRDNRIVFKPTKGGKRIVQHLSPAVGNSLVAYVCHGRPVHTPYREVFLSSARRGAPSPMHLPCALSSMISRRLRAADIVLPEGVSRGSHSFRHAFATRMVCGSQPFKTVADMLGHKSINSTMIYTKIDLPTLRQTACEWPETAS